MSDFVWKVISVVLYRRRFAVLGTRSWLRRPLMIKQPQLIRIGHGCMIRDGARIEVIRRNGLQSGEIRIGDNVTIEQDVHLVAAGLLRIGDGTALAPRVSILAASHPTRVAFASNRARLLESGECSVAIGRGCLLGANVVVLPNVSIGDNCVIGANSVITRDIPANSVVAGVPGRVIRDLAVE